MTRKIGVTRRNRAMRSMALLSVSYLALAAASPCTLYAQSAPQAPEAGKTEAPASPPSAPAEAPASPAPSAQPGAAPSSSAPTDEQQAPDTKSSDVPLPPVTIYPPREKPRPPVIQSREAAPAPIPVTPPRAKTKRTTHATAAGTVRATTPGIPVSANTVANAMRQLGPPVKPKVPRPERPASMRTRPQPRSTRRSSIFRSRSAS
jgi:hypothetical protein